MKTNEELIKLLATHDGRGRIAKLNFLHELLINIENENAGEEIENIILAMKKSAAND